MSKRVLALLAGATALGLPAVAPAAGVAPRQVLPFDAGWRFSRGDFAGAELPGFPDSAWRRLDLPHDWSIEGPFDPLNPTGGAGGFLPAGVGWYRKRFSLPEADAGRRVWVEFDGVMANSDVWINGYHLGRRPYGYVSFGYELTGHLRVGPGEGNLIAVRVNDADQPASRWYSGAGIYRHVRLVVESPVHIEEWGTFVTTPAVAADAATVRVSNTVADEGPAAVSVSVRVALLDPQGRTVAEATSAPRPIPSGGSAEFVQEFGIAHPGLWDLDRPNLYRAVSVVLEDGAEVDDAATPFGIRDARFEAATGFWLNGRNLKIKGVCLHADGGAFGAAVPLDVWRRRLEILKGLGANAIRCAHNPPAPEFLDLCDRMGFLVMDEMFDCWTVGKNIADYHLYFRDWSKTDVRDTVRRDRNHPSIVLYSAGNEIHDTPDAALAKGILSGLVAVFHANDPTRPVTQALLRPNASRDYTDGLADLLDVIGTNYRDSELLAAHEAKPSRRILGTENHQDRPAWLAVRDNPPYSGQFLWSGIDYLGESHRWPVVASPSGLIDRVGTPRPRAYQRQSWWSGRPMVRLVRRTGAGAPRATDPGYSPMPARFREVLFRDWTPADLGPHEETVEVYSNCERVELFLNGRSLGSKPLPADASPRDWAVGFEPGTIRAVAWDGGRIVAADELRTAGPPARIVLEADKTRVGADWDSIATLEAKVVDAAGALVPGADERVTFRIDGPGMIAAVDNGDIASHEPFRGSERSAYRGRCFAFVRATASSGTLTVSASAPGLAGGSVALDAGPDSP